MIPKDFKNFNSADFGGDFGLVNERFFKNFERRKVDKSSWIPPSKIRLRFQSFNQNLWTKIRKRWKWTFSLTFLYNLSVTFLYTFCP